MSDARTAEVPDLQYPIGRFEQPQFVSALDRTRAIDTVAALPARLAPALDGLTEDHLETPYRPGGWTIRQVVHHLADSHMNAYSRMRHALTMDWPTIYAYNQGAWAELPDSRLPVAVSLGLLDNLHQRWVSTMRAIADTDWATRGYVHPENGRQPLQQVLPLYAWHSAHHLAHIVNCRERHGW